MATNPFDPSSEPLGSTSPLVREVNTKNLDIAMNNETGFWRDRFGVLRPTLAQAIDPSGMASSAARSAQAAESARDAAFVNADVYSSVSNGLAGTSDQEQFQVFEGDEIVRYRNNAGSASEVARYPAVSLVQGLLDYVNQAHSEEFAHIFADESGYAGAGIARDGVHLSRGYETGQALFADDGSDDALTHVDQHGFVVKKTNSDGHVESPVWGEFQNYEVLHILNYGQSLSLGAESVPVLSTAPLDGAFMFQGGPQTRLARFDSSFYDSIVPLVEIDFETPCYGICRSYQELSQASSDLFITADGAGGTSVFDLSRGTDIYNRLLFSIREAKARYIAQNKTFGIPCIFWTQGERDIVIDTSADNYEAGLKRFITEVTNDIKTATGQRSDIPVIGYQTASHLLRDDTDAVIANAQLSLYERFERYMICVPGYIFNYAADELHLTNESSRLLGYHYGTALDRVFNKGENVGLHVSSIELLSPRILSVRLNNAVGDIAVDTTQVAANQNHGFTLRDRSGAQVAISSVSVVDGEYIKIVAASDIKRGFKLRYALDTDVVGGTSGRTSGARGNIRDSQGDRVTVSDGVTNYRIDNWLLMFQKTI